MIPYLFWFIADEKCVGILFLPVKLCLFEAARITEHLGINSLLSTRCTFHSQSRLFPQYALWILRYIVLFCPVG